MQQIEAMLITLDGIGFRAIKDEDKIQLIEYGGGDDQESILEEISHCIKVFITFDNPEREESDYLFQGCELKVPFDEPELKSQAQEVKFYVTSILNEHGIFNKDPDLIGEEIEDLASSPEETIVP
ncbi:MAG: hypothetical protein ACJAW3_000026 [Lentimonas sp.]|jgi:hypothetical protein